MHHVNAIPFLPDDEHVVHYAGEEGDGDINFSGGASGGTKATIRKESYWNVVEDSPVMINNALDKSHKYVQNYDNNLFIHTL